MLKFIITHWTDEYDQFYTADDSFSILGEFDNLAEARACLNESVNRLRVEQLSQHSSWHLMDIANTGTTWLNKNNKVVDHSFFKVGDGTGFNSIYNYLEVIEVSADAAVDENLFDLERGGWAVSVVRQYFETRRKN
jgi:hypothetical protein